jgi:hypothetical protein
MAGPREGALKQRQAIAQKVASLFAANPAVSSVLVIGSVASGQVDERSDVDLLVLCRSELLPRSERARLLSQVGTNWRFQELQANPLFGEADVDGLVDGVLVTVHYQRVAWIETVLPQVLEQGAITTQQLPFRPYTLPALLLRGGLLHDQDGLVGAWREQMRPFPAVLKTNLLHTFIPRLEEQRDELVATAERDIGPRAFLFHLNGAVDALIQILFAVNEVYDPADRRTERGVLPTLPALPEQFLPRLTQVLQGPFDVEGARYRAQLFAELAQEVLQQAKAQMKTEGVPQAPEPLEKH